MLATPTSQERYEGLAGYTRIIVELLRIIGQFLRCILGEILKRIMGPNWGIKLAVPKAVPTISFSHAYNFVQPRLQFLKIGVELRILQQFPDGYQKQSRGENNTSSR